MWEPLLRQHGTTAPGVIRVEKRTGHITLVHRRTSFASGLWSNPSLHGVAKHSAHIGNFGANTHMPRFVNTQYIYTCIYICVHIYILTQQSTLTVACVTVCSQCGRICCFVSAVCLNCLATSVRKRRVYIPAHIWHTNRPMHSADHVSGDLYVSEFDLKRICDFCCVEGLK